MGELLQGTWDLPRPGIEPTSPALAGRIFSTEPSGKPCLLFSLGFLFCFVPCCCCCCFIIFFQVCDFLVDHTKCSWNKKKNYSIIALTGKSDSKQSLSGYKIHFLIIISEDHEPSFDIINKIW